VVYVESKAFTAQFHSLAGAAALDVLNSIQADLAKDPARGDLVQEMAGIRKRGFQIRRAAKANEADFGICSCIWKTEVRFISCIC
jgi:hypothetical protein